MKAPFQHAGRILSIVVFLFVIISARAQEKIPTAWQAGMKLTMSYGGGMHYYSYSLEITDTGSFFMENDQGLEKKYILKLTKRQLDEILQYLIKRNFSQLKSEYKGFAYDKASESIGLSWDGKYLGATENNSKSIAERYKADFSEIQGYLYSLAYSRKGK